MVNQWNIEYAKTITTSDRLNHHICDCSNKEILAIKDFFYKEPKTKKLFDRATRGMAVA